MGTKRPLLWRLTRWLRRHWGKDDPDWHPADVLYPMIFGSIFIAWISLIRWLGG